MHEINNTDFHFHFRFTCVHGDALGSLVTVVLPHEKVMTSSLLTCVEIEFQELDLQAP